MNKSTYKAGTRHLLFLLAIILVSLAPLMACENEAIETAPAGGGKTENVIIVVIDGPRYSETWGDPTYTLIPQMGRKLREQGTLFTNFYNMGFTKTNPGHTAIATGVIQDIENNGNEIPQYPSLLQLWLQQTGKPASSAWLVTSKGKLNVLANAQHPDWNNKYTPSTNCGENGKGQGYRNDAQTMREIRKVLTTDEPNLMFINFREPDGSGHAGRWNNYLKGIKDTDAYVAEIWDIIQNSKHYRNNTVLLVTNDHGRHLNNHLDGFKSHGDDCEGCRHISLFAIGNNVPKNKQVTTTYDQTDISVTVASMLGFEMPYANGEKIKELLPE
ncbi:sulfatase-like hydrolase/transferase [Botryobacter ruber]|uniref:sulfatase-like hydrolase/transferase n=1 Tax=Botryobacter ruber TaxID=2171629 RepID=UPI000E0AEB36|nr:sulfatase-like hydrolase/transferase [Botryobacter ruber]